MNENIKNLVIGQGNPICKICNEENESITHIIALCLEYSAIRERILQEFSDICIFTKNRINFESIKTDPDILTQFILDPTGLNINTRVHISDPQGPALFKVSRDYCYAIHEERTRRLQELNK